MAVNTRLLAACIGGLAMLVAGVMLISLAAALITAGACTVSVATAIAYLRGAQ